MATKKSMPLEIEALNTVLGAIGGLEPAEQTWVLQAAATRVGVSLGTGGPRQGTGSQAGIPAARDLATEPKEFLRTKDPKNDVQRVACLAYFLTHQRGTAHFKSRDISTLNTEAAGPRVNISRAVNNATNQNRYLATAGGGKKQITSLGEDVVKALPDQETVQSLDAQGRPKRKALPRRKKRAKGVRGI